MSDRFKQANAVFERFLSALEKETKVRAVFCVYALEDNGEVFSWSSVAFHAPLTREALYHMAQHELFNRKLTEAGKEPNDLH